MMLYNYFMGRGSNNYCLKTTEWQDEQLELEKILQQPTFQRLNYAFIALTGSKAHGLANADSDTDLRGVFLAEPSDFLGIFKPPEQVEDKTNDVVIYELAKFVRLASKANPSILEAFYSPKLLTSGIGDALIASRELFLSQQARKSYLGYSYQQLNFVQKLDQQFKENKIPADDYYKKRGKRTRHMLRLMSQGAHLLEHGYIQVKVTDSDYIRSLETADLSEITSAYQQLEQQIDAINSPLPEICDQEKLNQLTIELRG